MRIAIIGRSELLYDTAVHLRELGHEIALVITAKEAPEYTRTADDFEQLAVANDAAFIKMAKISGAVGEIEALGDIDVAVSINYSGIIPQQVIDCFRLGILNAHGGDLPRYRGNACQAWAIINGEERVGLCIHSMIGGELDNGPIIARDYMAIDINTKVGAIWDWMVDKTPALYGAALDALDKDDCFVLEVQSEDPKDALRCYPRKPEDGRIDWSKSAEEVLRLINACNKPYAGAFCYYNDRKIIIWDAELCAFENFLAVPGQITSKGDGFVEVACGEGKIRIGRVEEGADVNSPDMIISSLRDRFS